MEARDYGFSKDFRGGRKIGGFFFFRFDGSHRDFSRNRITTRYYEARRVRERVSEYFPKIFKID